MAEATVLIPLGILNANTRFGIGLSGSRFPERGLEEECVVLMTIGVFIRLLIRMRERFSARAMFPRSDSIVRGRYEPRNRVELFRKQAYQRNRFANKFTRAPLTWLSSALRVPRAIDKMTRQRSLIAQS